jgi:DNA-binding winged helix-turn-helix (wHTH) protein
MSESQHPVFSFPPFRLHPSQRLVTRAGQPISLTPKEFETLVVLVEAAGRVVDKEELVNRVWPNSYVGDGSLARNISVLRKTLGEDVIQTHRGRGYRIAVPVVNAAGHPVTLPAEPLPKQEGTTPGQAGEATVQKASRRWRPAIVIGSGVAAVLLITFAVSHLPGIRAATGIVSKSDIPPIRSVVVEMDGSADPQDEGFGLVHPEPRYEYEHVLYNRETNGWDRQRIRTDFMNFYERPLSAAEEDFALQRDWKLSCVCALEEGGGYANIDFGSKAGRFDIELLQEGHRYFVALTKQVSPKFEWVEKVEFPGVADVAHPHRYELRFDHVRQSANLWIDGQQVFSGYRGHHQFLGNRGVMFGTAIYGNAKRGSFVFRTVRFEAE